MRGVCAFFLTIYFSIFPQVINWNYNVAKANACRQLNQNPVQCDRSVNPSLPLLSSIVTCKSCYAYLGADLQFVLLFDREKVIEFKVAASGAASTSVDIQVAFPNGGFSQSSTVELSSRRNVGYVSIYVGYVPLSVTFFATVSVELSASCSSSGRIVGPGFWYDASMTVGKQYLSPGYGYAGSWTDLTATSFYMNQRAPSIDIQVAAQAKARFILDIELEIAIGGTFSLYLASGTILGKLPLHFFIAPSLTTALSIDTRCSSNMVSLSLSAMLEAKSQLDSPSLTMAVNSYSYTFGNFFTPFVSSWATLIPSTAFVCLGCGGCVSGSSAPPAVVVSGSGTCASSYVSGSWSACSATCGSGVRTRAVSCRDCNGYTSTACTGTAPVTSEACDSGVTCATGPTALVSYSSYSSSLVKATNAGAGYKIISLAPPANVLVTPVTGVPSTYTAMAITLQVLSGDVDLYLFYKNPAYFPNADGSTCCTTWGSCASTQYYPEYFGSSCTIGLETEKMNLQWGTSTPYTLFFVVAGRATTTSLYTFTGTYYNKLVSSIAINVPSTTALQGSRQLFQFTSAAGASGFIVFASPTASGDPDIYCSAWNTTAFPTTSTSAVSAATAGADSLVVTDPRLFFPYGAYAVMVNNFAAGSYSIIVADLFTLQPGIASSQLTLPQPGAAVFFDVDIPPSADRVIVVLTNAAGSDADLYVSNVRFRPFGDGLPCNCAYKSERGGDDFIHLDWLDPEWSTTLRIAVMSYSATATFSVTVFPIYAMGEAIVYRLPASFAGAAFLMSGEGRTPQSHYGATTGHLDADASDCEAFGTCGTIAAPSFMSSCIRGSRLLSGGDKHSSTRAFRSLSFETPVNISAMGLKDTYVFGARLAPSVQGLAVVEANVMSLKLARKFPGCFCRLPPTALQSPATFSLAAAVAM